MNASVRQLYDEYLMLTSDTSAAASLTLAEMLQSPLAVDPVAQPPTIPPDRMLNLQEAARYLGYTANYLRKIVGRSRRSHQGRSVRGPTIDFSQGDTKSTIFFRREWLDQFIEKHHVRAEMPARAAHCKRPKRRSQNSDPTAITRQWAAMAAQ
jgi:hypothetical protein